MIAAMRLTRAPIYAIDTLLDVDTLRTHVGHVAYYDIARLPRVAHLDAPPSRIRLRTAGLRAWMLSSAAALMALRVGARTSLPGVGADDDRVPKSLT